VNLITQVIDNDTQIRGKTTPMKTVPANTNTRDDVNANAHSLTDSNDDEEVDLAKSIRGTTILVMKEEHVSRDNEAYTAVSSGASSCENREQGDDSQQEDEGAMSVTSPFFYLLFFSM
jgi:hypothetical protein